MRAPTQIWRIRLKDCCGNQGFIALQTGLRKCLRGYLLEDKVAQVITERDSGKASQCISTPHALTSRLWEAFLRKLLSYYTEQAPDSENFDPSNVIAVDRLFRLSTISAKLDQVFARAIVNADENRQVPTFAHDVVASVRPKFKTQLTAAVIGLLTWQAAQEMEMTLEAPSVDYVYPSQPLLQATSRLSACLDVCLTTLPPSMQAQLSTAHELLSSTQKELLNGPIDEGSVGLMRELSAMSDKTPLIESAIVKAVLDPELIEKGSTWNTPFNEKRLQYRKRTTLAGWLVDANIPLTKTSEAARSIYESQKQYLEDPSNKSEQTLQTGSLSLLDFRRRLHDSL